MRALLIVFVAIVIIGILLISSGRFEQLKSIIPNVPSTLYTTPGQSYQYPTPGQPYQSPAQQNPDDQDVGALNHAYLQALPYSKLIIEIDYIEGGEPTAATKSAVKDIFETYSDKSSIAFAGSNVITPTKDVYTVADLEALEDANRQHYTTSDTAVIYMMFVNGQFESSSALGVTYSASTTALFPERINDATTSLILYSQIEKAVAVHEVGHLLGLVNINYNSARDHHDANHPGHSNNENSVMYWAVEDISLKNVLNLGPPSNFDEDDIFDLRQIKSGVY